MLGTKVLTGGIVLHCLGHVNDSANWSAFGVCTHNYKKRNYHMKLLTFPSVSNINSPSYKLSALSAHSICRDIEIAPEIWRRIDTDKTNHVPCVQSKDPATFQQIWTMRGKTTPKPENKTQKGNLTPHKYDRKTFVQYTVQILCIVLSGIFRTWSRYTVDTTN